jgi:phosphate transport system protein
MERHFERDLDELRAALIRMGDLVERQTGLAVEALLGGDTHLADSVIAGDRHIDALDNDIEQRCERLLALTQPVAVDLRLLIAVLKINTQLERVGDIAVNLAERVAPLEPWTDFLRSTRVGEMAAIARIMLRDSLDALRDADAGRARRVLESDDVVDRLCGVLFREGIAAMDANHALITPAAHLLILSRHLERLADHATNIAEDVFFHVEARIVRHNNPG